MTWALPADQRRLLDLFDSQPGSLEDVRELAAQDLLRTMHADLLLLWAEDPRNAQLHKHRPGERSLPDAIVVCSGGIREFLAWASTVITGFRPFTAFFKVVTRNHLEKALHRRQPTLGSIENALVGLIIGEALALSGGTLRTLTSLSLLPCESTYSFTFARAWALGDQHGAGRDPVAEHWLLARKLTGQPARRLSDDSIRIALGAVSCLASGSESPGYSQTPAFVRDACTELHDRGEVKRSWLLLDGRLQGLGEEMKGPREQRVLAFERFVRGDNNLDPTITAFLTGLLADQIGPGTFEHVELLAPYLHERPMAAVWYGLCAGLHPDSEVQQVGNCLGRRLARDLLASDPLVSPPQYDISIQELEVCLDREVPVEFRTASQNHVAVELLPGVPAFMKWPVKEAPYPAEHTPSNALSNGPGASPAGDQRELFGGSDAHLVLEMHTAIADIERATARARALSTELSRRAVDDGSRRGGERRRRGSRR